MQLKAIAKWVPGKPKETPVGFVPRSPDSMLGTIGGSSSSPFIWNHSAVPIFWDLQVQFFLHSPDYAYGSKKPKGLAKEMGFFIFKELCVSPSGILAYFVFKNYSPGS